MGRAAARAKWHEHERALADFNEAIALQPERAWAYVERGLVYEEAGDYRQALDDFEQAIVRDRREEKRFVNTARLHKAQIHERLGKWAEALAAYRELVLITPRRHLERERIEARIRELEGRP